MSDLVRGILSGTPLWVWVLFAYLMWLGSRSLKPSQVPVRKVAVLPVVFIVWGLSGLTRHPFPAEAIAAFWLGGLAGGLLLGLASGPRLLAVDRDGGGIIHFPASPLPLIRNLLIFGAHYVLNVLLALRPADAASLMQADIAVSGASAGYFVGWAFMLWQRYRAAPAASATASAG